MKTVLLPLFLVLAVDLVASPSTAQGGARQNSASPQTNNGPQTEDAPQTDGASRSEELQARRLERLKALQPLKAGRFADILATAETNGFDQWLSVRLGRWRAGLGKISQISNLTPTVSYERPRIGRTGLTLRTSGAYSVTGYRALDLRLGRFGELAPYDFLGDSFLGAPFEFDQRSPEPTKTFLYGDLRYRNFTEEIFYGLGPESEEVNRTDYRYEEARADVVAGYQLARWVGVQFRTGYLSTNVGPGRTSRPDAEEVFSDDQAPGLAHQPDFLHYDSGLYLGWEADPNEPAALLGIRFASFDDLDGSRFEFKRFSVDARGYVPLGSRQRMIALRYYASRDYANDGAEVPFYLMKSLGGQDTLRGYKDFRFRDANLLYLSGEYRWEATAGLEFAVFYDTGKAFARRSEFHLDGMKHTFGWGIRAKNRRRVSFRMDVGRTGDGNVLLFLAFGPSF